MLAKCPMTVTMMAKFAMTMMAKFPMKIMAKFPMTMMTKFPMTTTAEKTITILQLTVLAFSPAFHCWYNSGHSLYTPRTSYTPYTGRTSTCVCLDRTQSTQYYQQWKRSWEGHCHERLSCLERLYFAAQRIIKDTIFKGIELLYVGVKVNLVAWLQTCKEIFTDLLSSHNII